MNPFSLIFSSLHFSSGFYYIILVYFLYLRNSGTLLRDLFLFPSRLSNSITAETTIDKLSIFILTCSFLDNEPFSHGLVYVPSCSTTDIISLNPIGYVLASVEPRRYHADLASTPPSNITLGCQSFIYPITSLAL